MKVKKQTQTHEIEEPGAPEKQTNWKAHTDQLRVWRILSVERIVFSQGCENPHKATK